MLTKFALFNCLQTKIINKVAFLVHEPTMYAHYSNVWAKMRKDDFIIVLLNTFVPDTDDPVKGVTGFMEKINSLGYEYTYIDNLLYNKIKYKYVVSNHLIGGSSLYQCGKKFSLKVIVKKLINFANSCTGLKDKYLINESTSEQYIPLQVGLKQIRFMYGADIGDGWSLQSWNEMYDLFLCHGPNDEAQLKKRFHGKTEIMGYPRYDEYFSQDLDVNSVVEEFGIDLDKKTILWMSTMGNGASSIPAFAELISGLRQSYNIIARPHPIAFRLEPKNIELLRSLNFTIDDNAVRDMNKLYKLVDYVLCDFGGSAFGAIYLGKKMVLLDVPNTEACDWVSGASNFALRDSVPIIGVDDFQDIINLLANDQLWDQWESKMRTLSDKYFADYRGSSSQKAAEILTNLDSILDRNY